MIRMRREGKGEHAQVLRAIPSLIAMPRRHRRPKDAQRPAPTPPSVRAPLAPWPVPARSDKTSPRCARASPSRAY
eukprot:4637005-Pleurochrysis_carterae.AAC.1